MFAWLVGSPTRPPILLGLRSSKHFIVVVICTAIFTDIFLYGIIVPVLPFALNSRAGVATDSTQTWIAIFLAVYGAALLAAAPICGWLADKISSRRWPLLAGLLALAGSTVMLCVGDSIALLAIGRALQGVSGAVVWVVGLALMVDTLGAEELGTAMGYIGLSLSLAFLLAPLLGGVVFAAAGYYAVFAMAFALIAVDIVLRLVMIEKKVAMRWKMEGGNVAADSSVSEERTKEEEIQQTVDEAKDEESDRVVHEKTMPTPEAQHQDGTTDSPRRRRRLPPVITLFASRRLLSALWLSTIQASLVTAFDAVLPLFVKKTFDWDSTGAGLIFLPIVVATFVGPLIGWASDKFHAARWLCSAGFLLACPALILLRLVDENSIGQKVLLCALLFLVGLGLTFALTPVMAEIGYAVNAKAKRHPPGFFGRNGAYAQAYSLFNMAWAAGCLIGPLLGGLINSSRGWGTMTLVLGCISAITAVPAVIWTGGSLFKLRRAKRSAKVEEPA